MLGSGHFLTTGGLVELCAAVRNKHFSDPPPQEGYEIF